MLKIKELREKNHILQKDLAKILNIGLSTLNQYESGKRDPSSDMLIKIADYFNVTVDFLLGRENKSNLLKDTFDYGDDNEAFNQFGFPTIKTPKSGFNYGKRLKELRSESNLSQEQAAKIAGENPENYKKIEDNYYPLNNDVIRRLADYYNCPYGYLSGHSSKRFLADSSKWNDTMYAILVNKINDLSPKYRKKLIEYIDMLLLYEKNANGKGPSGND